MEENIVNAIADLREEEALKAVKERLDTSEDPIKILESARGGMSVVGNRFEKGEYFLSDLLMAAEIFRAVMESIKPRLKKEAIKSIGKVVIGTVEGDVHNIGKDIFTAMLDADGFEVHDLGVDAPPQKFVEKIKEVNPQVVGMSGLITLSIESMKKTSDAIKAAGLRDKVKIVIGGGRADEETCRFVEADAWADNASKGVRLCKEFVGVK